MTTLLLAALLVSGLQDKDSRVDLTPADAAESWTLSVMPLPPQDGQPGRHAFLFIGSLKGCTTPRTFPIVFVIDGDERIPKQGALLSREKADGGCVDGLATVFREGAADALAKATRVSVSVPNATFELTAPHLDYVRRKLAERASEPAGVATATLRGAVAPLPTDPAAGAAAAEASTLNARSVALANAGRLKEARQAAEGAVAADERAYGPDHPQVGQRLSNLGLIERELGNEKEAIAHYQRAIRLLEPAGPSEGLGVVLDNLGRVLLSQKDLDGAAAATSRAVDVLSTSLGPRHEHVGYALNNLALLWHAKGDAAKAAETCDRAIDILTATLGPGSPKLAPFLEDQRMLRQKAGRK
jgi:tetratricopeptide (TPR) repeat protein